MHAFLLEGLRIDLAFDPCPPWSLLVFDVDQPADPKLRWHIADDPIGLSISVWSGTVGVIGCLQDGGLLAEAESRTPWLMSHAGRTLHPVQFLELAAKARYWNRLIETTPSFLLADGSPNVLMTLPLGGLGGIRAQPWNQEIYAHILSMYTGFPLEGLYHPPSSCHTWLADASGAPLQLSLREWPHPGPPQ
jgi:hypothetical protein